jgi:hypothetical protein
MTDSGQDRPPWATALYAVAWIALVCAVLFGLLIIWVALALIGAEPQTPVEGAWVWVLLVAGVPIAVAGIVGSWLAIRALRTYRSVGPDPSRFGMVCGRCGKPLSPYWLDRCRHCNATLSEFPPVTKA